MGVCGACRKDELLKMTIDDVEDKGSVLIVKVPDTKTYNQRTFVVDNKDFLALYRKYVALRPNKSTTRRLFLNYKNGRCTCQVVGTNTIGKIPTKIAEYLKLPDAKCFTGHCFRRSSATLLAESGADLVSLKRHGGWRSSTVAEGYIEDSVNSKIAVARKIFPETSCSSSKLSQNCSETAVSESVCAGTSELQAACLAEDEITASPADFNNLKSSSGITMSNLTNCTLTFHVVNNKN